MKLSRRSLLHGAMAGVALPWWLGGERHRSQAAQDLIRFATDDLGPGPILDAHVHIVGLGTGGSGCWVNPHMLDPIEHPLKWARFQVYRRASGIEDLQTADQDCVQILLQRMDSMSVPVRALIFGFDRVHDEAGAPQLGLSEFYTPDSHVFQLAAIHPQLAPVVSIHPYRTNAVEALHAAAEKGAVAVKWLPNAQRMDPASPSCDAFYRALQSLDLPLITHAGHEQAVEAADAQELGDPLRLRRPLDAGVRVIVAHCASLGEYPDSDDPARTMRPAFDLFLRLMDTPAYEGLLWGEISAMTVLSRIGSALPRLLRRTDLHHRLIHGSDYPIPAINPLINTWQILAADLIDREDRAPLAELWDESPLLFEFVLKRCLRLGDDRQARFPVSVFQPPAHLFPGLKR